MTNRADQFEWNCAFMSWRARYHHINPKQADLTQNKVSDYNKEFKALVINNMYLYCM